MLNESELLLLLALLHLIIPISLSYVIYTYLRIKYPHWITGVKNENIKDTKAVSETERK